MFSGNGDIGTNASSKKKKKSLDINYMQCPMDLTPNAEQSPDKETNRILMPNASAAKPNASSFVTRRAPITKIFIDDLTERRKVWRVPWFIVTVCVLQISCHLVANDCMKARLMYIPKREHEYWRYLTYMLLHSDRLHLLLNVVLQCLIGFWLECEQGGWRVGIIYAAGGISGPVAMGVLQPMLWLIGASAGVYALLLSHLPHLLKNFSQLSYRYLRIVALIILCLSDVIFTAYHFIANGNANPRICVEAHVAGALSGLCIGMLLYKRLTRSGQQYRSAGHDGDAAATATATVACCYG